MTPELNTALFLAVAVAVIGLLVWSVQRIVGRIDAIGKSIESLATRVTVIETKQDMSVQLAARADKVGRATAGKVGVHLPADLEQTIQPAHG